MDPVAPGGSFYRGDAANLAPGLAALASDTAIQEFILKGWMPQAPFIGPETNVVAFGSGFAAAIVLHLLKVRDASAADGQGAAHVQKVGDGTMNVFALCQQFEWAWENRVPSVGPWPGWKAEEFGYDEKKRLAAKKLFDEADVFFLNFGLSEICYDEPTGEVLWRAVPKGKFDAERHGFRMATHAETVDRLRRIHGLIRQHRPAAAIVFSLSPFPLMATFRSISCIAADALSKARLRSAIDEVQEAVAEGDPLFFYFPAYEIILHGFKAPFHRDLGHLHIHVLEAALKIFEHYFCKTSMTDEELRRAIKDARDLDAAVTGAHSAELAGVLADMNARWKSARPPPPDLEKEMIRKQRAIDRAERDRVRRERTAARALRLAKKVNGLWT